MSSNGALPHCHAPDCPSPTLRGEEAKPRGHALVGGREWHFGCWWKYVHHIYFERSEPDPPAVLDLAANCMKRHGGHKQGSKNYCVRCNTAMKDA